MVAASNLAEWEPERFLRRLNADQTRHLKDFLGEKASTLNRRQRVLTRSVVTAPMGHNPNTILRRDRWR